MVRRAFTSQWRVSWYTTPPSSSTSAWRRISYSRASCRFLKELRFFISQRVPNFSVPRRRSEMLPSQRMEPDSMEQSEMPMVRKIWRSFSMKRRASSGLRRSGSVTSSISGVPQRL